MPEPLLTVEQFQQMFGDMDLPNSDTQLKRPLGVALRRIKSWVGVTVYDAAVAADEEDECKNDLQAAAGYLAMHFLIVNFNTVVRVGGIVKTEKVEGDTVLSYLTPDDTIKRSQEFFELADEMVRPWRADASTPLVEIITECDE